MAPLTADQGIDAGDRTLHARGTARQRGCSRMHRGTLPLEEFLLLIAITTILWHRAEEIDDDGHTHGAMARPEAACLPRTPQHHLCVLLQGRCVLVTNPIGYASSLTHREHSKTLFPIHRWHFWIKSFLTMALKALVDFQWHRRDRPIFQWQRRNYPKNILG